MKVSVITLTFNEEKHILEFLNAIPESESYRLEVLIADGGSTDQTLQIIQSFKRFPVKILHNVHQFTPHGMNLCIAASTGDYIVIAGARSMLSKNYITEAVRELNQNKKLGCVGGLILHKGKSLTGKSIAKAMGAPLGMGLQSFRSLKTSAYVDTVSCPVFPKSIIDKIGTFDENLIRNQDEDFSYRLIRSGYRIKILSAIHSQYYVREKYALLAKQFFQYSFWKSYVNKKHRTLITIRQCIPALFLITFSVAWIKPAPNWPSFSTMILLSYLTLMALQSIRLNTKEPALVYKTFLAFLCMHSSYAIGYLWGILYAFILNKNAPHSVTEPSR